MSDIQQNNEEIQTANTNVNAEEKINLNETDKEETRATENTEDGNKVPEDELILPEGDKEQKSKKALKKEKKKGGVFGKIIKTVAVLLLIILIPLAGFLLYSAIDGAEPAEHIPEGHYAYINLPSLGDFFQKTLSVKTLDSVLASSETAQMQGLIRSLRASPELSSWWFKTASNIRLDAAAYGTDSGETAFLIFAKLGFRSAATRALPLVLKIKPDLFSSIKELQAINENNIEYWIYDVQGLSVYIGTFKDSVIISSSKELFLQAFTENENENTESIKKFIKNSKKDSVSILSDINGFKNGIKDDNSVFSNAMKNLAFDKNTVININLNEKALSVSGNCNWETEDSGLKNILKRQAFIPGILNRLPKSTDYITLINMGSPDFLFDNGHILFNSSILNAYNKASSASRFLFKKDINELLFSWMGDEIGLFGLEHSEQPVFFVSLKDEKKCRAALEDIFSSIFIEKDVSALVDGLRIPRIEFPDLLKSLLRAFKVELPRPFYVIDDGFLYLSQSAEAVASLVNDVKAGNLLVKTENWKSLAKIPPETSIFVYYTVEKQIPNLLRSINVLKPILKDYGKGILSIKTDSSQRLSFEFHTQRTESHSLGELAAFPYKSSEKITGNIYCGKNSNNVPFVYWTSGNKVYALNLADKTLTNLKLDDKAYLNVQLTEGRINSVWAVSSRGTIYKTDYSLKAAANFPILTGEKFAVPPVILKDGIVLPVANKPLLLFADKNANTYFSEPMDTRLKNQPFVFDDTIAAAPRSFDSMVYLFDRDGKIKDGYPSELESISAVQPVLYKNEKKEIWTAILTEEGKFSLKPAFNNENEGFSIELNVSCRVQPVYSENLKMFFLIADAGYLYKIDTQCRIVDKIALKQKNADDYVITLADLTGDKLDDVLISGGGNSVYAYGSNFIPLEGFPVSGTGNPCLIDVDGDGKPELITCGIDNSIHSYRF
ncbi:FG-GAP repeat domain-containing protein [Treponema pedis]|uniref:VCBS repeat-containing protein n=1 Tax=Treponema pedis TaxID=409322 RepID=A0A7S6WPA7_9SPIR|nr:VCBS repeat-containing protein [Treponema pedis]QOW60287.1 VCBS repeat-containing protein [Treponema pedis]